MKNLFGRWARWRTLSALLAILALLMAAPLVYGDFLGGGGDADWEMETPSDPNTEPRCPDGQPVTVLLGGATLSRTTATEVLQLSASGHESSGNVHSGATGGVSIQFTKVSAGTLNGSPFNPSGGVFSGQAQSIGGCSNPDQSLIRLKGTFSGQPDWVAFVGVLNRVENGVVVQKLFIELGKQSGGTFSSVYNSIKTKPCATCPADFEGAEAVIDKGTAAVKR